MTGNGLMTNKMERERRNGQMDQTTRANTSTGKNREKVYSHGRMNRGSKVTSLRTRSMALGPMNGQMGRSIPGSGRTIRCLGRGS